MTVAEANHCSLENLNPDSLEAIGHGLIQTARRVRLAASENREVGFEGGLIMGQCDHGGLEIQGSLTVFIEGVGHDRS